jgi:hypothetical protein
MWRSDDLLVIHRDAKLPDRCIKTNQPAHGKRLKVTLEWYPQRAARYPGEIEIITVPTAYFRLGKAFFTRKKVKLELGVSETVLTRQRNLVITAWGSGFVALLLILMPSFSLILPLSFIPVFMGAAILLSVISLFCGLQTQKLVEMVHFEHNFIWIKGVSPSYLEGLPSWSGIH